MQSSTWTGTVWQVRSFSKYNYLTRSVSNAIGRPIPSLRRPEYETSILPGVAERPRHRVLQTQAERVPSSWGGADHLRRYGQVLSFPLVLLRSLIPYPSCTDRDGTIDMIFPTCESFSTSTGIGHGCSINIAYNKQKPLCASTSPGTGGFGSGKDCRSPDALCVADPDFKFNFQSSPEDEVYIYFPLRG